MPSFLPPDAVRFELQDGTPLLRFHVEEPAALSAEGWSFMNRLTLCVVDGPGDAGYLITRVGPDGIDPAPEGWDEAVDRAAGSMVVFGTGPEAPTVFVPSVD